MSEGNKFDEEVPQYEDYQMPTTEIGGRGNMLGQSPTADVITATGNLNPDNFWMVVMIILMLGFGGGAGYWVSSLYKQVNDQDVRLAKKDVRIEQLEKALYECPEKTLEDLKKTQETIEHLRGSIKVISEKAEVEAKELIQTNTKLKQIEKGL